MTFREFTGKNVEEAIRARGMAHSAAPIVVTVAAAPPHMVPARSAASSAPME